MTTPESNDKDGPVRPPVIDIEAEDVTPAPPLEPAKLDERHEASRSVRRRRHAAQAQIASLAPLGIACTVCLAPRLLAPGPTRITGSASGRATR